MANSKADKLTSVSPLTTGKNTGASKTEDVMFEFTTPDDFRKAFIASEILNRKY